jgi:hypothetical protein
VGGIPEQAAGFGYLLQNGSEQDIADSVDYVLDHYTEYRNAARAMSQHAEKTYSINSMVEKHLELYQRLAGQSPRRHRFWLRVVNPIVRIVAKRWGTSGPPSARRAPAGSLAATK